MNMEVELKFYVGSNPSTVKRQLETMGWCQYKQVQQEDIYYTSSHHDFVANEECLRIRNTPNRTELTWKPPTSKLMKEEGQYWKEELDLDLTGQADATLMLMKNLGFDVYVTVKKFRHIFQVDKDTSLFLDNIESLGWFVEIETFTDTPQIGVNQNRQIAEMLHLNDYPQITIPYRDMVKSGTVPLYVSKE